jgi:Flp pilus assembly protein TadD
MYRNSRRVFTTILLFLLAPVFTLEISAQAQSSLGASQPRSAISVLDSTREQDGLLGSVRRVKIESAKIEVLDGRTVEGPHQLLELTTYGFNGNRLENISYPGSDSLIGKEEYKYDNRGNIIEMTLRNDRGAIVNREAYSYEFDTFGNWTKMITNLVVFENGQLKREPVEVTYRTVTYYFNDSIADIVDESAPQKMPRAPESTELQPPSLEKNKIDFNTSRSGNVSAAALEPVGAPPPLATKPREVEKTVVSRKTGKDETNTASRAARAEAVSVRFLKESSATNTAGANPNAGEVTESKLKENVSAPITARNSSAAESSRTGGSPVNFKPSADVAAQKTAFDYYQVGKARLDAGDVKAAVEAYLDSIKLEPNSAEVFLNLGVAYLKLEKDNAAAKAFKESVKLNPDVAEAHYGLGLALYRLNRFRDAVAAFKKATNLSPKMAKAHFGLGLVYQELNDNNSLVQEQRILENLDKDLARRLAQTLPTIPCKLKPLCQ